MTRVLAETSKVRFTASRDGSSSFEVETSLQTGAVYRHLLHGLHVVVAVYVAQVGTTEVNNKIRTNGRAEPALLPWDAGLHERNCSVTAQRVLSQAGRRPRLTVTRRCQWRASSKLPRELYVRSPTNGLDLCQGRSRLQFFRGGPQTAHLCSSPAVHCPQWTFTALHPPAAPQLHNGR